MPTTKLLASLTVRVVEAVVAAPEVLD